MSMSRKQKCLYLIRHNGDCHEDGETCFNCSVQEECQFTGRNQTNIKEFAVQIFLEEFGTKEDLVEALI